jgi:hypothetical protein
LHVIVYEGAKLPFGISSLEPWLGSKEGEVANMKSHFPGLLVAHRLAVAAGLVVAAATSVHKPAAA